MLYIVVIALTRPFVSNSAMALFFFSFLRSVAISAGSFIIGKGVVKLVVLKMLGEFINKISDIRNALKVCVGMILWKGKKVFYFSILHCCIFATDFSDYTFYPIAGGMP